MNLLYKKAFPGCEVLGDLLPENIDGFTLEADECKQIDEVLKQEQNAVANALEQIIQGENSHQAALELIKTWQVPLQAAQKKGIAQFKREKLIKSIKIG